MAGAGAGSGMRLEGDISKEVSYPKSSGGGNKGASVCLHGVRGGRGRNVNPSNKVWDKDPFSTVAELKSEYKNKNN